MAVGGKEYISHHFNVYCQKKEFIFSLIKKTYPPHISDTKLNIFTQRIKFFEEGKDPFIKLFERYLLNFRTRLIYKETLVVLGRIAHKSCQKPLLYALKETGLLKYLPLWHTGVSYQPSVFLQLQCFRGVLSKKDMLILSDQNRTNCETREAVSSNISMVTEKFDGKLFTVLEDKKKFIENDTGEILKLFGSLELNTYF